MVEIRSLLVIKIIPSCLIGSVCSPFLVANNIGRGGRPEPPRMCGGQAILGLARSPGQASASNFRILLSAIPQPDVLVSHDSARPDAPQVRIDAGKCSLLIDACDRQ